jgi:hypothetical protein
MSTKSSLSKTQNGTKKTIHTHIIFDIVSKYLDIPNDPENSILSQIVNEFKLKHPKIMPHSVYGTIKKIFDEEKDFWKARFSELCTAANSKDVKSASVYASESASASDAESASASDAESESESESKANEEYDTSYVSDHSVTSKSSDSVYVKDMSTKKTNKIPKKTEKRSNKYKRCINRLESYSEVWSLENNANPIELAEAGFYYMGFGDNVKCFSCDLILSEWDIGDDPMDEHMMHSKKCEYINSVYLPRELRFLGKDNASETTSLDIKTGESVSALFKSIASHIDKITSDQYSSSFGRPLPPLPTYTENCACPACKPVCTSCNSHNLGNKKFYSSKS